MKIFNCYAGIATLILMLISCGEQHRVPQAAKYNTITISTDSVTIEKEYTAVLRGVQTVEVRPQVSGKITKIMVKEGAKVRSGEVMFILDQIPYRAALESAKAQVKSAEAEVATARLTYNSKVELRRQGVISDYEVEQSKNTMNSALAALASAQAAELNAQNDLSYTEVKSPSDGVIGMIPYRVGALVSSTITEPLAVVSDNSSVYAYFSLSESELQKMISKYGSLSAVVDNYPPVQLRLSDGSDYDKTGQIDAISGNVDDETGAVSLRATFANPDDKLRNGGSACIVIPYAYSGIIIPQEATFELQEKTFVYKVIDGKTKSAEVNVAEVNNGTQYIVTSGLNVGDIIISEGVGLLHDGIEVSMSENSSEK
ncbi:MAG: efflux RND transporter periplasmic adaptor subunit [Muribaculaceae bacterium]